MNGARRLFFAACAGFLRLLGWLPLWIGSACADAAEWCEERSR